MLFAATAGLGSRFRRREEPVEHSLLLRVLVQVLVTLGIASVAVAASGVTQTSGWNLAAIPLSAMGAAFSWQRRNQRNIAVKFMIAVGMLLALAAFFSRLLGQPGDTRIVLAELLIHLQVLHSFDLPRRKDLGYSMMIGLILLGVAATISQTLAFAPLLLAFLVVALPVLVLDYRSRLGLAEVSWRQAVPQLALGRLLGLALVAVGLGLTIFLLLPRLPGYQLQNFPVSSTIEFNDDFNGQSIVNPGYVSGGTGEEGEADGDEGDASTIQGTGQLSGPGTVDDSSYYGFNQTMNQNLRGTMTPRVVMRVRSQAEGFWRVLAFDRYTGQGWEISRNEQVETLERSNFNAQINLPIEPRWGPHRDVVQTYTLVDDFPNLIPAMYQARNLYFPTRQVAIDLEGGLRSPVSLRAGMTYTVISKVNFRDRTALGNADTEYSGLITGPYLQIPETIAEPVRQRTEALLATAANPLENPYEKALYLAQTLKQRYTLQPELPFFDPDQDLVSAFLFDYEGGYPDHFSTALTMMLRSIGIPARLASGFGPGEFNPFTGFYVVRNVDAFAVTEVYFPRYGWFAFDPIPGHEVIPPSIRESETFTLVRRFWNWIAGWLPSPLVGWVEGVFGLFAQALGRLIAWVLGLRRWGWVGIMLGIALAVGVGFGLWLAWRGLGALLGQWRLGKLPPMEQLYQRMLDRLARQGWVKGPSETPAEFGQRLYQGAPPAQAQAANEIAHAYVRWRYGGEDQNLAYLKQQLRSLQRPRRA